MNLFNKDELLSIALHLKVSDILTWGRTCNEINRKVCNNDDIWRRLIIRDYSTFSFDDSPPISPRQLYTLLYTRKVWNLEFMTIQRMYQEKVIANNTLNVKIIPANLYLPNLEILDLTNNHINYLPDILHLPNLKILRLAYNNFQVIPTHLKLPSLKILSMAYNNIAILPLNLPFPNLRDIDLYGNRIEWVPERINLTNLKYIRFLDYGKIRNLEVFKKNHPDISVGLQVYH